jgi:hypothetical protein
MTAAVTKAGPYYSSGSISFSSLRSNFKESASGSISASELRRNTTTTNTNPVVPDATENASISTSSNLKLSHFRNTIKYYYITQTGTDTNFDIDGQSWNTNLNKNILKWLYVRGTIGSNSTGSSAADFNSTAYNLTIDVSGRIYGAGGVGGTSATISGGSGGNALSITNTSGSNLVVNVQSTANIYGGGGGGEKGATGGPGTNGTCTYVQYFQGGCGCPGCPGGWQDLGCGQNFGNHCSRRQQCNRWGNCWWQSNGDTRYNNCKYTYAVSGGSGGVGGDGGPGRGYNNFSGSVSGSAGAGGSSGQGCTSGGSYETTPGTGITGETGGAGGDWAALGGNTNNSGNGGSPGRAITGSNYTITGTINANTVKGSRNPS